jgi:predicted nucleotidyltransferase
VQPDFDPRPILQVLVDHGVDFVLIGGLAGVVLGSAYQTGDVDVVYERSKENLERVAAVLRELGATLRGAPNDLPLQLDAGTLAAGQNFTFDTPFGSLDILGDPAGAPHYETLRADSTQHDVGGVTIAVTSIDHLIAMKEAAGQPRDKLMVSEYKLLADEIRRRERER